MKRIAVSLYDYSCTMLYPWRDAGYECWAVDIMHHRARTGRCSEARPQKDLPWPFLRQTEKPHDHPCW